MPTFSEVIPLLWDATWQAALLAMCVAAVCRIGRRHVPPAWRFALWGLVFARLALPVLPGSPTSLLGRLPGVASIVTRVGAPTTSVPSSDPSASTSLPDSRLQAPFVPPAESLSPGVSANSTESAASSPVSPASAAAPPVASGTVEPVDWWQVAGAIWLLGAVLVLCRQVVQHRRLQRLAGSWSIVTDPTLSALLEACRRELHVRQTVRLVTSDTPVGPALTGLISSTIVVPRSLIEQLSREQLRMVLLHELCHVRRRDVLWDRLANLLLVVHWFNPAAWWARSQLRLQREQACDALVLQSSDLARQLEYGRLVVELASRRASNNWARILVGASGSPRTLKRRIDMIADYRDSNWRGSLLGALLLTVGVACGLTRADSKPQPAPEATVAQSVATAEEADDRIVAADESDATDADTYRIEGVCRDENQSPLSGVRVRVFRVDGRAITREQVAGMETGAAGAFDFPDLPMPVVGPQGYSSTYYVLAASRAGRVSSLRPFFSAEAQTTDLQLSMGPSGSLSGRVTDPDGEPVAGADVFVASYPANLPIDGLFSATTDAEGRYELSDLLIWDADKIEPVEVGEGVFEQTTSCFYTVQHPDYATGRPMYTKVPSTIDVTLQPAATIEGRVIDEVTGRPAAGALVSMQMTDASGRENQGGAWQQVTTDGNGRYRLTSLAAAEYNIWADAPDRTCAALDSVEVAAGETLPDEDIKLIEGGWIEGRIVDADSGDPLTHAANEMALRIGLHGPARPKSGAAVQSAPVGDDGRFRIQAPPGRNYPYIMVGDLWQRVEAKAELDQGVEVGNGEIVSLEFRVLDHVPRPTPAVSPVRLPVTVPPEREAGQAVRELGGWYQVDDERHVIEVNMVYHYTDDEVRYDNDQVESDEVLQWLPSFPRLKRLFLKEGQASDEGLAHVSGLRELEVFFVWDARAVSDAGIEHLRGLDRLKSIHLGNAQIGDQSLAVFGSLPALEDLSLQGNTFTDDGVRHLVGLSQLRSLWIGGKTRYSDEVTTHLSQLPNLQELDLQPCRLSDDGLRQLAPLRQLRRLYVGAKHGTEDTISNESLPTLLAMRELTDLSINNTQLDDDAARQIADLPNLKSLMLTVGVISRDAIAEIREQHPELKLYVGAP